MNAHDILFYGHRTVMKTVEDLDGKYWQEVGVTNAWSVKDVIAHLASFELVFEDILKIFLEPDVATPNLDSFKQEGFNDREVEKRKTESPREVLDEYTQAHERVLGLIEQIPKEMRERVGTLPWYGQEYSLDDFIVYNEYGHKREHSAQIKIYRRKVES